MSYHHVYLAVMVSIFIAGISLYMLGQWYFRKPPLTGWSILIFLACFTAGAFIPWLWPSASAQERSKVVDPVGELIRQIELQPASIPYPEWGADEETFPSACDKGSYRSRLNCARLVWDRQNKVANEHTP